MNSKAKQKRTINKQIEVLNSVIKEKGIKLRICARAGVSRDTLDTWLKYDAEFRTRYNAQLNLVYNLEKMSLLQSALQGSVPDALEFLREFGSTNAKLTATKLAEEYRKLKVKHGYRYK